MKNPFEITERSWGPITGLLTKSAFLVLAGAYGSLYGGPLGGYLAWNATSGLLEIIDTNEPGQLYERWLNFKETINPFNWTTPGKNGPSYAINSHLSAAFAWITITCGCPYFTPFVSPYFVNWMHKGFQSLIVELAATRAVAIVGGALCEQANTPWQNYVYQTREATNKLASRGIPLSNPAGISTETLGRML